MDNDHNFTDSLQFRPELISRKGELIAWFCAFLVGAGWFILVINGRKVPGSVLILGIFLLFSALAISLGNWMDRHTHIRIYNDHLTFGNGLRHAIMVWDDIRRVEVIPSKWGKKVSVQSEHSHFEFRTLGEVDFRGEIKGRLGFRDGDKILDMIIQKAGLKPVESTSAGYYYTRQ